VGAHDDTKRRQGPCPKVSEQSVCVSHREIGVDVCIHHRKSIRLGDERVERSTSAAVLARPDAALRRIEAKRPVSRHKSVYRPADQ
jgi:hypothetical protein